MKKCAYCGTTIVFGGKKHEDHKDLEFCSEKCLHKGIKGLLLDKAKDIPEEKIIKTVEEVHSGRCPKCNGPGPVDAYTSHSVYSLLFFTSWYSTPHICCRSCGTKSQFGGIILSLVLGWWGFPWGFLMTPVQIIRNIHGLFSAPSPSMPSEELKNRVRLLLAAEANENNIVENSISG